jgi:hypothetical protein
MIKILNEIGALSYYLQKLAYYPYLKTTTANACVLFILKVISCDIRITIFMHKKVTCIAHKTLLLLAAKVTVQYTYEQRHC